MLKFSSGSSTDVNLRRAVAESMERASASRPLAPCLIVVHSTMGHPAADLLRSISEMQPEAVIVGCSGSGVVGREGVSENIRALAVMVVTGPHWGAAYASGIASGTSFDRAAAAAWQLKESVSDPAMIGAFVPGMDICADKMLRGIESVFGTEVPIFGALSGDNGRLLHTLQFFDRRVMEDGIVLFGFGDPELRLVQGIHHGSLAQEDVRFTVTKAEGNRVDEVDGKPFWPTFVGSLGLSPEVEPVDVIAIAGLGIDLPPELRREYNNDQILRFPMRVHPNRRSAFMCATCPEGTEFVMVQRDEEHIFNGVQRLIERLKSRIGNRRLEAVFQADCMARGRLTADQVVKDELIAMVQDPLSGSENVPWLGIYGFGELGMLGGRNEFHNYTTTLSVVVREPADAVS